MNTKTDIKSSGTFFDTITKVGNALESVVSIPVFILSIAMTITVLLGVFCRYIIRFPLGWTEELSRYLMIWMALLSVALCIWRHEHIGVTLIIKKVPLNIAKLIILFSNVLIFYFLYILAKYGFIMANKGKYQISSSLSTTMKWWLMAVPVSAVVCMIFLACKILLDIKRKNVEELLMSEEVIDAVKREENLDI
ncbi:TRAP transporter small permease [Acetomicrobium mobile]|uniref:TRAP transporter small permease n=1 Tax=Acetomicrobium mobile TaxID=97477 RepID=UPI0026ECD070|nr:TRAP transporter small permease [Acetomicrobium mobile]